VAVAQQDVAAGDHHAAGGRRVTEEPLVGGKLQVEEALVGPLAASIGGVEIAVTALGDFAQCPMLYRWRHDLRIPRGMEKPARSRPTGSQGDAQGFRSLGLDAATLGTLYHKCMELLDLAHPQPADLLLAAAAAETEIDDPPAMAALAGELAAMLVKFRGHELWGRLAAARQTYRELDFVMDCPPATLRGQIDLLVCDAAGRWRIVDYKSDDVDAAAAAEHAARYQLQMLLYAAAAQGRLGRGVESATLYFLRPAVAVEMDVSPAAVEAVRRRAGELAGRLVAARREGQSSRTALRQLILRSACRISRWQRCVRHWSLSISNCQASRGPMR